MCKMTETGARFKSAIDAAGYWLVYRSKGGEPRYVRWHKWAERPVWLGLPFYAVNIKARDWGARA